MEKCTVCEIAVLEEDWDLEGKGLDYYKIGGKFYCPSCHNDFYLNNAVQYL